MSAKSQRALIVLSVLLLSSCFAHAQLRPEVTPTAPKKAPAKEKPTQLVIETSPSAEVYLDDQFAGRASPKGRLVIANPTPGEHGLRVSLAGKKDLEQKVTVVTGQVIRIPATLVDFAGRMLIHSYTGAEVFLDSASRGRTDASGELAIAGVGAGSHELRIASPGKKEYRQNITVPAGQEARVDAPLADLAGAVVVHTSPGAAVFLDGSSRGTTDASGQLSVPDVVAGSHELRITASSKKGGLTTRS